MCVCIVLYCVVLYLHVSSGKEEWLMLINQSINAFVLVLPRHRKILYHISPRFISQYRTNFNICKANKYIFITVC